MSSIEQRKLAEKCINKMNKQAKFDNHLGIKILEIDVAYVKLSMEVKEFMLNGHGSCQGGAIFSFADTAFAYACNGRNIPTVAYSCDITYIKAVLKNDTLYASAKQIDLTKRNGIYSVEVKNQNDELVALFIGKSRAINGQILTKDEL